MAPRYGRLLVVVVVLFVVSGIEGSIADVVTNALGLIILAVAFRLTALRTTPPLLAALALLAIVSILATIATEAGDEARAWPAIFQAVLLLFIVAALLRSLLRRKVVDIETLYGAVTVYLLIGLAFAWAFIGIEAWDAGQFSINSDQRAEFFEFSFVVLTTLGFGNEVPTAPLGGRVVVLEAIAGQIFLATFLARLVSLYGQDRAEPA